MCKIKYIVLYFLTFGLGAIHAQSYYALDFVENKGQWEGDFKFKSIIGNGVLFLNTNGYTVLLNHPDDFRSINSLMHGSVPVIKEPTKITPGVTDGEIPEVASAIVRSHAYKVKFLGATSSAIFKPEKPTGEKANYFLGEDTSRWERDVASYSEVRVNSLYPGIDIRYYSNGDKLKYDIIVKPKIDPSKILIQYDGIEKLYLKNKELIIKTSVGESKELRPIAYQIIEGVKKEIKCEYVISGSIVKYKIENYDTEAPLIIDPELVFATYTGSKASNFGFTAAPGPDGSLYAGGIVFGSGYPISVGAFQASFSKSSFSNNDPGVDVGLTRFSPDGRKIIFSTYLGGGGNDFPHSIYVDKNGNAIVLGRTNSRNFPNLNNRLGNLGGYDIFVSKISSDGTQLLGSIQIGGSGDDGSNIYPSFSNRPSSLYYNYGDNTRSEVILDNNNNVYVAASTFSADFPLKNPSQASNGGKQDGVFMKLTPNLSSVVFSTFIGGSEDDAAFALSINPLNNNVFVAGATNSKNLPGVQSNTIGSLNKGGIDGYISVFDNNGLRINATYLGTSSSDFIYGIQFDTKGFPYVMGITLGTWQVKNATYSNPGAKQFIAKLKTDLSDIVYSTTYGRAAAVPNISPVAFLVDRCENVYVSGWGGKLDLCNLEDPWEKQNTGTAGMPYTSDAIQSYTDGRDFYLFVLKRDATDILYGSFFGQQGGEGDHVDGGTSRFDNRGAIYQAICANCYGDKNRNCPGNPVYRRMLITPQAAAPANGAINTGVAGECNLAAFKINFEFGGVRAGALSSISGKPRDTSGCLPLTVDFSDTIATGKSYKWVFNDGTDTVKTSVPETSHTFTKVGTFKVLLISLNPDQCITSDTSFIFIKVSPDKATLGADFKKIGDCNSFSYSFLNNSIAPPSRPFSGTSFVWDFGDKTRPDTTGKIDVNHTFPGPGTYKVRLTLNDKLYCNGYDYIEFNVYVTNTLKASFTTPSSGCLPYTAEFKNTSIAGKTFTWDFGDNSKKFTGFAPLPKTYNQVGDYTITLVANDPGTCNQTDVFTYTISVKPTPSASFSFAPDPPLENTATQFNNLSSGATGYHWDFGDYDTSTAVNPLYLYNRTGNFKVCLSAKNNFGCADTVCSNVSAKVTPVVDIPNAFTPNGDGKNDILYVRGFGIAQMNFKIYNRLGQVVFESGSPAFGWDGRYRGILQPMDVYAYTLIVQYGDGSFVSKKGDVTLVR